jgi:hypothetical protein
MGMGDIIMKKLSIIPALILVGAFSFCPLLGNSFRFRVTEKTRIYSVELRPGEYRLKLFDDVAGIYKGEDLLAVAKIKIEPLARAIRESTYCCDGVLKEVRLKDKRVIFVELLPSAQSGGSTTIETAQ